MSKKDDYLYHRNQNVDTGVDPVIDRSKIHGYERINGKLFVNIGDEYFEVEEEGEQKNGKKRPNNDRRSN